MALQPGFEKMDLTNRLHIRILERKNHTRIDLASRTRTERRGCL